MVNTCKKYFGTSDVETIKRLFGTSASVCTVQTVKEAIESGNHQVTYRKSKKGTEMVSVDGHEYEVANIHRTGFYYN